MTDKWTATELLQTLRRNLVQCAGEAAAFRKSWGDEYGADKIQEAWACKDAPARITVADLIEIPDATLQEFGFRSWDGALRLIPLWAFNLISDGEELTSISGDTARKGDKSTDDPERGGIDLDVRFGCIAYGFTKPGAVPTED